jgi:hypothetical protein
MLLKQVTTALPIIIGLSLAVLVAAPAPPPVGVPTDEPNSYEARPFIKTSRTYTREEFAARFAGKSEDEVVSTLGLPDSVGEAICLRFYYKERTCDTATGKDDHIVTIFFNSDHKVERFTFR